MFDLYTGMYDYDAPTIDVYRTEDIQSTRKPHTCIMCGLIIPPGSPAKKHVEIHRGEGISTTYVHKDFSPQHGDCHGI